MFRMYDANLCHIRPSHVLSSHSVSSEIMQIPVVGYAIDNPSVVMI